MKSTRSFSLVFAVVGLTAARLPAQTVVDQGLFCTDTTWDLAGSPYIVTNSIIIGCNACLTIDPGVEVRFDLGLGITVGSNAFGVGCLVARGTVGSEIVFTSNVSPPAAGDWSRIFFTDFTRDAAFDMNDVYESGSILEHVIVEYAGDGFPAVTVDQSSPFITNSEIRHNDHRGIDVNGTNAPPIRIEQSEIWDNHVSGNGGGIFLTGGAGHRLIENDVHDCSASILGGAIFASAQVTLDGNTVRDSTAFGAGGFRSNRGGGGVFLDNGSDNSTLTSNTIINNMAPGGRGFGGGVFVENSHGLTLLISNIIAGNSAGVDGGGIFFDVCSGCTLTSNTIADNTAENDGAGIFFRGGDNNTLTDNTIVGNHTTNGNTGGIFVCCGSNGLSFDGDPVAGVFNRIYGNDGCDVFNDNPFDASGINDVGARHVWWGTCDPDAIEVEICDFFDDPNRAFVISFPFVDPGGDSEFDGDVDLDDFARFNPSDPTLPVCFTGPCGPNCNPPLDPACGVFDFDCDGDVDERDFGAFANLFTGAFK